MGRLLFVVSLAALAWWGYSAWRSGPARQGNPAVDLQLDRSTPLPPVERDTVEQDTAAPPAAEPRPLQARVGQVAEAAAEADPGRALELLGDNNSFLHDPGGRAAGEKVLELAASLPDEESLAILTGLIERSMRGPIGPEDAAAKGFVNRAYEALRKPVKRRVFDPTNLTRARSYRVKAGDALSAIARKLSREHDLKLESGTLALVNRISNPNAIRAGQVIKVPTDPFVTVLEKRSFLMAVYLGPTIIRLYWVGHGEDDITPETEFVIADKVEKPDWYHPDGRWIAYGSPENVLGEYFVKFSHPSYTGFGAHGTDDVESIGTMQSMGCIRMRGADIQEYFRIIPRGSKVIVRGSG